MVAEARQCAFSLSVSQSTCLVNRHSCDECHRTQVVSKVGLQPILAYPQLSCLLTSWLRPCCNHDKRVGWADKHLPGKNVPPKVNSSCRGLVFSGLDPIFY